MANTLIHETRRLQFPLDTLVDALIELEAKQGHWPASATVVGASVEPPGESGAEGVMLSIHRSDTSQISQRRYTVPMIAAAMVNYCVTMRVPMPRNSSKSIEILADGVALLLENTVMLQSRHAELSTLPAGSVEPPAPASRDPAPAPAANLAPASADPALAPADAALSPSPADDASPVVQELGQQGANG